MDECKPLLLGDELHHLDGVNVAAAFRRLAQLARSFPRSIAADDGFRALTRCARGMCDDGRGLHSSTSQLNVSTFCGHAGYLQ